MVTFNTDDNNALLISTDQLDVEMLKMLPTNKKVGEMLKNIASKLPDAPDPNEEQAISRLAQLMSEWN